MTLTMLGEATSTLGVVATTGSTKMLMTDSPPKSVLAAPRMANDATEGALHRDRDDVGH